MEVSILNTQPNRRPQTGGQIIIPAHVTVVGITVTRAACQENTAESRCRIHQGKCSFPSEHRASSSIVQNELIPGVVVQAEGIADQPHQIGSEGVAKVDAEKVINPVQQS